MASACPHLESLTAPFSITDATVAALLGMSSLMFLHNRAVNMVPGESIGTVEPDALRSLAAGLPSLASLWVGFQSLLGDFAIESASLRSLRLSCRERKDTPRVSLRCPALRVLIVPLRAHVCGDGGECLARLAGLERVEAEYPPQGIHRDAATGAWPTPIRRFCGCAGCGAGDSDPDPQSGSESE